MHVFTRHIINTHSRLVNTQFPLHLHSTPHTSFEFYIKLHLFVDISTQLRELSVEINLCIHFQFCKTYENISSMMLLCRSHASPEKTPQAFINYVTEQSFHS